MKSTYAKRTYANALPLVFCLILFHAEPGMAVDYTLEASGTLRQDYNTNIRLLPKAFAKPVWASDIDVTTSFQAASPTWLASAKARFDNWFYNPGLDVVDEGTGIAATQTGKLENLQNQYIDGRLAYLTERSRWELTGGYISDFLLTSQTLDLLGIIIRPISREIKDIAPSWTYNINEYTKLGLTYSYRQSDYPGKDAIYPSSLSHTLSTSLNHQVSDRFSLSAQLAATKFSTRPFTFQYGPVPGLGVFQGVPVVIAQQGESEQKRTIDFVNFMLGFSYILDENTDMAFSGGGQYSQTTSTVVATTQNQILASASPLNVDNYSTDQTTEQSGDLLSPLFDLNLHRKFENSNLVLRYKHQASPSVNSLLFTTDHVSLHATHSLSQRLKAGLRFSYYASSIPLVSTSVGDQNRFRNQDLMQMGGDISYAFGEHLIVRAAYDYKMRELSGTTNLLFADPQDAHIVSLSLRYEFDKLHY